MTACHAIKQVVSVFTSAPAFKLAMSVFKSVVSVFNGRAGHSGPHVSKHCVGSCTDAGSLAGSLGAGVAWFSLTP